MASSVAIACMVCAVFGLCGASSQNRLARRIAALEKAVGGLTADLLAERDKQQQQSRKHDKKHEILEQQIRELRVRLDQTGVKGEPGPKGDTGLSGLKGEPGLPGSPGQDGPRGLPGVSGLKGDPGVNGRDGRPGSRGPKGLPGVSGLKGDPGVNGRDGRPGSQGPKGLPGVSGLKGDPGVRGRDGRPGSRGPRGFPGTKGVNGQKGDRGRAGLKGESGLSRRPNTSIITLDVPVLRFTKVYDGIQGRVFIEDEGAAVRDGLDRAGSIIVRTDGLLTGSRRHYWETELAWSVRSDSRRSLWYSVGEVGVRREGSDFSRSGGVDSQSWAVWILYSFVEKKWRYECYHSGRHIFISQPVAYTNSTVTNRLGFLYDPANKTLTAVDVNTDNRICSFFGVNTGSQSLVPVVRFAWEDFQRRFRLPVVDPSRLPGLIADLLHN